MDTLGDALRNKHSVVDDAYLLLCREVPVSRLADVCYGILGVLRRPLGFLFSRIPPYGNYGPQ